MSKHAPALLVAAALLSVAPLAHAQQSPTPRSSLMLSTEQKQAIKQAQAIGAALSADRAALPEPAQVLEQGGALKLSHVMRGPDDTLTIWLNGHPFPSGWTASMGEGEAVIITLPHADTGLSLLSGQTLDLPEAR